MPDSLPDLIAEAERLHPLTTQGEWVAEVLREREQKWAAISVKCKERCPVVGWPGFDDSDRDVETHIANACWIAHAHNAMPPLIAAYRAAVAALESSHAERDRLAAELEDTKRECGTYVAKADATIAQLRAELAAAKQASLEVDAAFAAQLSDRLSGIVDGLTAKLATLEADLANERQKLAEVQAAIVTMEGVGIDPATARNLLAIIERGA